MRELVESAGRAIDSLLTAAALLQLAAVAAALALAWLIGGRVRDASKAQAVTLRSGFQARLMEVLLIVSPQIAALVLTAAFGGFLHAWKLETRIIDTAITLIGLYLLIRVCVFIVRVSLGDRANIKGWGNTITFIIWSILALHVLGWSEPIIQALDNVGLTAGKARITVWSVLKILFTVSVFILIAAWIARWIERRLMRMHGLAMSMRLGISKFSQALLIGLSVLLGLNAAGLDLTTLNVLTGAIGVGLGFGLQSIAANFVSGFVLLMDRSIKPGDVISFTGTTGTTTEGFGWVEELRGRYVVVRDRDGVATLVPNQHFITNPVINWSYTDPKVRLKLPVRVSYLHDVEEVLPMLLKAAEGHPRILTEPAAVARLIAFGDSGFEVELRFWIADPQEGVNNVRSDVNRQIWKLFKQHGIKIPVAQREILMEMKESGGNAEK